MSRERRLILGGIAVGFVGGLIFFSIIGGKSSNVPPPETTTIQAVEMATSAPPPITTISPEEDESRENAYLPCNHPGDSPEMVCHMIGDKPLPCNFPDDISRRAGCQFKTESNPEMTRYDCLLDFGRCYAGHEKFVRPGHSCRGGMLCRPVP